MNIRSRLYLNNNASNDAEMDSTGTPQSPLRSTGLLNLPDELVLTIFQGLPLADLYTLSLLSFRLHHLALPLYFSRQCISHNPSDKIALNFIHEKKDTMRSLRVALFITSIKHLSCTFSHKCHIFRSEAHGVKRLVDKLDVVEEVTIDVHSVNCMRREKIILPLLKAITRKSCRRLNFQFWGVTESLGKLQTPNQPVVVLKDMIRGVKGRVAWDAQARSKSVINTIQIHSLIPFIPGVLDWTIKKLNSASITHLEFRCSLTSQNWAALLPCLTAPNLSNLTIQCSTIPLSDVAKFLVRHPTLLALRLYTDRSDKSPHLLPLPQGTLPRLTTLGGNTNDITYLLKLPDTFPELSSISIVSWHDLYYPTDFTPINDALASLIHRSSSVAVSLSLTHAEKWFDVRATWDREQRVERSLHCVKSLELKTGRYCHFSLEDMALLPNWLALFPALERVSFVDGCINAMVPPKDIVAFVCSVEKACVGLKTLRINSNVYHIDAGNMADA